MFWLKNNNNIFYNMLLSRGLLFYIVCIAYHVSLVLLAIIYAALLTIVYSVLHAVIFYLYYSFFLFRYTFASGSPDNIKQWKFPDGNFLQNLSGHNAIINSLALNSDNVLVSGGKYDMCSITWKKK